MDQLERQKEMRRAMNARMCLMAGGLFLIFTAITSTIMYGINFFIISSEAVKGTAEYVEMIEKAQLDITMMRVIGGSFFAVGAAEVFFGVCVLRFSNRVDKAKITIMFVIGLLIVELAMQTFLFCMRLTDLGMLFTSVAIPLLMLWGVTRLLKMAKADPERVYAVQTNKINNKYGSAKKQAGPQKSVRERAMMQARPAAEKPAGEEDKGDQQQMVQDDTEGEKE